MLNVLYAAFNVAHDYDGGIPALALKMDISHNVLQKKFDPNTTTHHLRLDEAVKAEVITKDHRILHAHAEALGYVCWKKPENVQEGDGLLDGVLDASTATSDVLAEFKKLYADRVVSKAELPAFDAKINQAMRDLLELQSEVHAVAE